MSVKRSIISITMAHEMLRLAQPRETQRLPSETNTYFYEPRGVAAVIAPWNFPLAILTGMTAAALVTGNCVLMKPAEQSPLMGVHLSDILLQRGRARWRLSVAPRRRRDRRAFSALGEDSFNCFYRFARGGLGNSPRSVHAPAGASSCETGRL